MVKFQLVNYLLMLMMLYLILILMIFLRKEKVENFIKSELITYCNQGRWIADHVGDGPKKL